MFTGIAEKKVQIKVLHMKGASARLETETVWPDGCPGESIAVNGVCLTLLAGCSQNMAFDISSETLERTNLGSVRQGDWVNVERALQVSDRMGGHYVSGHIDCQAKIGQIHSAGEYTEIRIGRFMAKDAALYLLPKGSITIDGISLTINGVGEGEISCMLVPHTLSRTTLGGLHCGDSVNIEFDYLTRIVAHQLTVSGHLQKEVAL